MIALFSALFIGDWIWHIRPKRASILHHRFVCVFCVILAGFTWLIYSDIKMAQWLIQSTAMAIYAMGAGYCSAFIGKKARWILSVILVLTIGLQVDLVHSFFSMTSYLGEAKRRILMASIVSLSHAVLLLNWHQLTSFFNNRQRTISVLVWTNLIVGAAFSTQFIGKIPISVILLIAIALVSINVFQVNRLIVLMVYAKVFIKSLYTVLVVTGWYVVILKNPSIFQHNISAKIITGLLTGVLAIRLYSQLKKMVQLLLEDSQSNCVLAFCDEVGRVSSLTEMRAIIERYRHTLPLLNACEIWVSKSDYGWDSLSKVIHPLPDGLMDILNWRSIIYLHTLIQDSSSSHSATEASIIKWMKKNNFYSCELIQDSVEIQGILAIKGTANCLMSDFQMYRRTNQMNQLKHAFSRLISIDKINDNRNNHLHQIQLMNQTLSSFNIHTLDSDIMHVIASPISMIIPQIKSLILGCIVTGENRYNCCEYFTKELPYSIHTAELNQYMVNNIKASFSRKISNECPSGILNILNDYNCDDCLVVKVSEKNDDIIILILSDPVNILDPRIGIIQIFVQQLRSFIEYQGAIDHSILLNHFNKKIIDQLPISILIIGQSNRISYVNVATEREFNIAAQGLLTYDYLATDLPEPIKGHIHDIVESEDTVNKKIVVPINDRTDMFDITGFKLDRQRSLITVVMISNIQHTKNLIEQMEKTKRLRVISEIATGLAYELKSPINTLLTGIKELSTNWQSSKFQERFNRITIPQVDRVNLLCQSLLRLSRENAIVLTDIYMKESIDQAFQLIDGDIESKKSKLQVINNIYHPFIFDSVITTQIIMNVLLYAVKQIADVDGDVILTIYLESQILKVSMNIHFNTNLNTNDESNRLQLSIIHQIILSQNGYFNTYETGKSEHIDIQLPIINSKEFQTTIS